MRFLKNKIFRAQESLKNSNSSLDFRSYNKPEELKDIIKIEDDKSILDTILPKPIDKISQVSIVSRMNVKVAVSSKEEEAAFKNIAINFGKAIATFAASPISLPYLEEYLKGKTVTVDEFVKFMVREKAKICGISSFRKLLLIEESDDEKTVVCKKLFQWIGEVVIKCFSVNWIMHGRLAHKITYLKFRFKMLRRIKDPENFTYIKERPKKLKIIS